MVLDFSTASTSLMIVTVCLAIAVWSKLIILGPFLVTNGVSVYLVLLAFGRYLRMLAVVVTVRAVRLGAFALPAGIGICPLLLPWRPP